MRICPNCDAGDPTSVIPFEDCECPRPYKVEVIADNSGTWNGNGLRFLTREEAEAYAKGLASRWTLVREWRVVTL